MTLPRSDWLLIAAAGLLLTLAYPPFALIVPAFVCLVPAALLIQRGLEEERPWKRHLLQGFWYGSITHAGLLYWLAGALWSYGRGVVGLYVVAATIFGAATAVMFAVVGRISSGSPNRLIVALPAGVVFLEWLAANSGPIAFPWHRLALTVTSAPILVQVADIGGSGGLAFVIALVNVLIALAWWHRHDRATALGHIEVAASILFLITLYGAHRLYTVPLSPGALVAVVQPNVQVDEKWLPDQKDAIVERTVRLTELAEAEGHPDLIVWPETALPDPLELHPSWRARITQLTRRATSNLLVGGVAQGSPGSDGPTRYNAALSFTTHSNSQGTVVHRKQKLIPMVERVEVGPLDLSTTGFGGFLAGRALEATDGGIGRFGTLICYELTFEAMSRDLRRTGVEVLITMSNDAWFGRTTAPAQHFAHAVLRAVENRITVVRSANTGVSGIVDPLGRVVVKTDSFVETYALGRIKRTSTIPLAVTAGGLVGPAALALLLILLAQTLLFREPGTARSHVGRSRAPRPTLSPLPKDGCISGALPGADRGAGRGPSRHPHRSWFGRRPLR